VPLGFVPVHGCLQSAGGLGGKVVCILADNSGGYCVRASGSETAGDTFFFGAWWVIFFSPSPDLLAGTLVAASAGGRLHATRGVSSSPRPLCPAWPRYSLPFYLPVPVPYLWWSGSRTGTRASRDQPCPVGPTQCRLPNRGQPGSRLDADAMQPQARAQGEDVLDTWHAWPGAPQNGPRPDLPAWQPVRRRPQPRTVPPATTK